MDERSHEDVVGNDESFARARSTTTTATGVLEGSFMVSSLLSSLSLSFFLFSPDPIFYVLPKVPMNPDQKESPTTGTLVLTFTNSLYLSLSLSLSLWLFTVANNFLCLYKYTGDLRAGTKTNTWMILPNFLIIIRIVL